MSHHTNNDVVILSTSIVLFHGSDYRLSGSINATTAMQLRLRATKAYTSNFSASLSKEKKHHCHTFNSNFPKIYT